MSSGRLLLARGKILLPLLDGEDAVQHLPHGRVLREAETTLVGQIVHAALALRVLAVDACNTHAGAVNTTSSW